MTTLLAPETARGRGSGHLRRCIRLLSLLDDSQLLIPQDSNDRWRGKNELSALLESVPEGRIVHDMPEECVKVVLDRFSADAETVLSFGSRLTIGLDLGGAGRELCSYLIDTLPRLDASPANVRNPGFLDLPAEAPLPDDARRKVLVSYGGEDSSHLTENTVDALLSGLGLPPESVTVVRPSLRVLEEIAPDVRVIGPRPSIWGLIVSHETVICSFGMTAFEARAVGRRVVTIAPSAYHDKLARAAGFFRAGTLKPSLRRLQAAMKQPPSSVDRTGPERPSGGHGEGPGGLPALATVIEGLAATATGCPAHPEARGEAVWRDVEKSYFVCPVCSTVYLERFRGDSEAYSNSYFFEAYKRQYGRTYLEDFHSIVSTSRRRLAVAKAVSTRIRDVLDIGCAYGPFMAAASEDGLDVCGVDVSQEAVSYVNETLGLKAVSESVLDLNTMAAFGRQHYDLVTLWYVIEHFRELKELLSRLKTWVAPGGVIAISTPNLCGVSGRRDPETFFAASPRDHHTIWHETSARLLLSEYGFSVRRVVCTGHHPERYSLVKRSIVPRWLAGLHSRLFGWGDTFELYAVREADG